MIQREHEMDFGPEVQGDHGSYDAEAAVQAAVPDRCGAHLTPIDYWAEVILHNAKLGLLHQRPVSSDFLDFVPTPS